MAPEEKRCKEDEHAAAVQARAKERQKRRADALPPFLVVNGWVLKLLSSAWYFAFQNDVRTIKDAFANYNKKDEQGNFRSDVLNLRGFIRYPHVAKRLIRHIVKYNEGIFDKMIADKGSVTDIETCSYIIDAELRYRPDHAKQVIYTFNPEEVNPRVYDKALKYATRLYPNIEKTK